MTGHQDTKRGCVRQGPRVGDAGHSLSDPVNQLSAAENGKRGNKDDHQGH
jgi:hypothetical protein